MDFALTPDLLFNTRQARQNASLRARLETVGQEVITGRRSDLYTATGGRIGDAFLLDRAALDVTRQQGALGLARARMESALISVSTVRETTLGFISESRVVLSVAQPGDLAQMQDRASEALASVTSALGRRAGNRHLFSGTQSDSGPLAPTQDIQNAVDTIIAAGPDPASALAALDTYFTTPGGGFETDIYRGSVQPGPRLHISNEQSLDPIPKGDDPLFRTVLQGFALIAGAGQLTDQAEVTELMQAGLNLLDSVTDDILAMESQFGASLQGIDRTEETLTAESALIASTQNNMLGRDTFDAAAELQALQGQLEASYTVTGRLGSLSLANFLR